jgi:hypothetical protein
MKIFGREPSLWIAAVAATLSAFVPLGIDGLSAVQVAAIVVGLNAVLGVANALLVRPVSPVVFTYAVSALAALLNAYGWELSPELVGVISAATVALLGLVLRGQVTPSSDPAPTAPAEGPVR